MIYARVSSPSIYYSLASFPPRAVVRFNRSHASPRPATYYPLLLICPAIDARRRLSLLLLSATAITSSRVRQRINSHRATLSAVSLTLVGFLKFAKCSLVWRTSVCPSVRPFVRLSSCFHPKRVFRETRHAATTEASGTIREKYSRNKYPRLWGRGGNKIVRLFAEEEKTNDVSRTGTVITDGFRSIGDISSTFNRAKRRITRIDENARLTIR